MNEAARMDHRVVLYTQSHARAFTAVHDPFAAVEPGADAA